MGWKSTEDLCRAEAVLLINARIHTATNSQLADAVEALGYGEDTNLPLYGHNFSVVDTEDQKRR